MDDKDFDKIMKPNQGGFGKGGVKKIHDGA
jgi:hypothetical protein